MLFDIILPLAIADVYTYNIPSEIQYPQIGMRVLVPLGKKSIIGIIYRKHEGELPASVKVRDVLQIIDDTPIVTAEQLKLWEWLSSYYMCTLGEVMAAALPSEIIDDNYSAATTQYIQLSPAYLAKEAQEQLLGELKRAKKQEKLVRDFLRLAQNYQVERRMLLEQAGVSGAILRTLIDKGIFLEEERPISRLRQYTGETQKPHTLDSQQSRVIAEIRESWQEKNVTLLHGVTSSGKTEVYIHLIEEVLQLGKQVLYLVPEIALTTQLTDRLQAVFGDKLVVYHSKFSNAERVEIYHEVKGDEAMRRLGNEAKVTIGKGVCLRESNDAKVAVLSIGAIGNTVMEAIGLLGERLEAKGEEARIAHYDMRWLKPMDESILAEVVEKYHTIITVEDGVISGGLGSAVAEFISDHSTCKTQNASIPRLIRLGVNDQFVEHGSTKELYHLLKLDKEGICESLLQALEQ